VYRTEINAKKHFRVVETSNMPFGNTVIQIQINVSVFIMNISFTWGL